MNPCPCGYHGDINYQCRCSPEQIQRYHNKLSGPLLERFDIHIEVTRPSLAQLNSADSNADTDSRHLRQLVNKAQGVQYSRHEYLNADLQGHAIERHCRPDSAANEQLQKAAEKMKLSARAYYRALRVARTIADLDGADVIQSHHITEALAYRQPG
jgi:magnesium chelatase family protein